MKILNGKIEDLELRRKILHVLAGIICLILLVYHWITSLIIFIFLVAGVITSLIYRKHKIPIISFFLDNFERSKDRRELPGRGMIFAFVGCLLALQLFEKDIALASIAILTFADPISHFVGKAFGKTKSFLNQNKNIEGSVTGFIFASIFASFFVSPLLAIPASFVAVIFELLIIRVQNLRLDDNLIIPLAAGTTMVLLLKFLPI